MKFTRILANACAFYILVFSYTMLLGSITGCSQLKPSPAKDSGFLGTYNDMEPEPGLSSRWISNKYRLTRDSYKYIIIPPVNTSYLLNTSDWSHIKTRSDEQIKKDVQDISKYMEEEFRKSFQDGRIPRLKLTDTPGPNTLVFEIALTELVPTDVVRNAAGNVAGFLVPGGGLVAAGAGGSIAVEIKVSDAETGEVMSKIKDRLTDQIAPIDLAGLTPYRHARKNIDRWVDENVTATNKPQMDKIAAQSPITLSPW